MRFLLLLALAGLVAGCAASRLEYQPSGNISHGDAVKIIERLIMEQPAKRRPERVQVTNDYIAYEGGYIVAQGAGVRVPSFKSNNERLYFDSIGELQLFISKGWYVIQAVSPQGRVTDRFYTLDERLAKQFMDAIQSMR